MRRTAADWLAVIAWCCWLSSARAGGDPQPSLPMASTDLPAALDQIDGMLRDPMAISYYPSRRERPPQAAAVPTTGSEKSAGSSSTPATNDVEEAAAVGSSVRLPGAGSTKPTKYHYYPHNQHIYLLPECAVQQVCNAVYVRLNYTQPLCACPSRYREPCSASLNSDDLHTTQLATHPGGKVLTLVKTCEPVADMRLCRAPRDWSLLALQNIRTGKSHYLVICRCPPTSLLEGPMSHDQPTYASVPGIRVYGMMCVDKGRSGGGPSTPQPSAAVPSPPGTVSRRRSRPLRNSRSLRFWDTIVPFPWHKVKILMKSLQEEGVETEELEEGRRR